MGHRTFCETFLAALGRGDFEAMGTMVAPDFVVHEAAGLPYGGRYEGIEGWRDLVKAIVAAWAGVKTELIEFVAEGENAAVLRLSLKGRSRRTGTSFETTVMELWRFRDGKLAEILPYYWDTALLAEADA